MCCEKDHKFPRIACDTPLTLILILRVLILLSQAYESAIQAGAYCREYELSVHLTRPSSLASDSTIRNACFELWPISSDVNTYRSL
jgi:hypothetical protein